MGFQMKYKNLQEVVDQLRAAVKAHGEQADIVEGHIKEMEKGSKSSPAKKHCFKKLTDLNNDGEITRADVLVGAGVIDKEGNPLKKIKRTKISGPCKAAAKRKFKVWPSAYASGWGVRCTRAGGPSKMGKSKKKKK